MISPQDKPTLLIECLGHVLSFLQSNQVPTLCSLLRVSKTLFQLTVPLLYQNPFLLVRNHRLWSEEEKTERLVFLLRLFFSELDTSLQSELPPWITADDEDEDGDDEAYDGSSSASNRRRGVVATAKPYSAQNGGYFYHYRRHDHSFLTARAIPYLFRTTTRFQSQAILAQLDNAFLKHCGSRIQSMCLPSTRVQQFGGFIHSLACLKRLEIHQIRQINEESLNALAEWIRAHDAVHGTLRELQIGGLAEYDGDDYDTSTNKNLVLLPLAFKALHALDTRSWSEAWSMIDEIPVEMLDRLVMDYGEGQAPEGGFDFLLRCRSLKVLDLFIPSPDTFQGVARLFKARHQSALSPMPGETPREAADKGHGHGLPPVERLYISGDHVNLREALDDAALGLSQSLRVLKVTSMARYNVLKPSMTWGRPIEAQMPFLQDLQLQGDIALEFDFRLLHCCPNLTSLKLMVNGMESCGQVDNPIEEILSLGKLQTLQLLGRWPLSMAFVRGIALRLTGLKMLDLARCFGIDLNQVMEAVHKMEFLWRVGWDMEEEVKAEELLASWQKRAPQIRIGLMYWDEFYA